ncbi:MAG: response regulator, partial [Opitutae bacterium]|nr:response regulator [Opitutae bacterium]
MHTDHPAHILIVDDTPTNLEVLLEILDQDYDVSIASSGDQALEFLQQGALPELILLDVLMPGLDGYQVCERIKA